MKRTPKPRKPRALGVILKYRINTLAKEFYKMQGYEVKESYDFSRATHPHEVQVWKMALLSFHYWAESK